LLDINKIILSWLLPYYLAKQPLHFLFSKQAISHKP